MIALNTERMEGLGPCELGSFQVNYLYGLSDLCQRFVKKSFRVLELGTNDGISASLFSAFAKEVVCVDFRSSARLNEILREHKNITFHNTSFENFLANDSGNFYDLIYIDGCHDFDSVNRDIENFKTKVKKNRFISGHDFNSSTQGVEGAVRRHFPDREVVVFSDSSWLVKV